MQVSSWATHYKTVAALSKMPRASDSARSTPRTVMHFLGRTPVSALCGGARSLVTNFGLGVPPVQALPVRTHRYRSSHRLSMQFERSAGYASILRTTSGNQSSDRSTGYRPLAVI